MVTDKHFGWSEHVIILPWDKPPLTLNDRSHWSARARKTRAVRSQIFYLMRSGVNRRHPLAPGERLRVELHYRPRDNRRRDTDNLVATLKPICDALTVPAPGQIGVGLVPDDTPAFMVKPEPQIHPAREGEAGKMWLKLVVLSPNRDE